MKHLFVLLLLVASANVAASEPPKAGGLLQALCSITPGCAGDDPDPNPWAHHPEQDSELRDPDPNPWSTSQSFNDSDNSGGRHSREASGSAAGSRK